MWTNEITTTITSDCIATFICVTPVPHCRKAFSRRYEHASHYGKQNYRLRVWRQITQKMTGLVICKINSVDYLLTRSGLLCTAMIDVFGPPCLCQGRSRCVVLAFIVLTRLTIELPSHLAGQTVNYTHWYLQSVYMQK